MIDLENAECEDEEPTAKSKSQAKREVAALQDLGVNISKLNAEQRATIPLDTNLRKAIEDAPKIKTNSAKRRHMQYIGKLMRTADVDLIKTAYQNVIESSHRATRQLHVIENWRDTLIADNDALESFIEKHPNIDRQHLRQLVRMARKDKETNKPEGARKLFRFVRDSLI